MPQGITHTRNQSLLILLLLIGLVPVSQSANAQEELWRFCAPAPSKNSDDKEGASQSSTTSSSKEMNFSADQVDVEGPRYQFRGKVVGRLGDQQISADSLDFDKDTEIAVASGNVRYEQDGQLYVGDHAEINIGKKTGNIYPAKFWITERHLRGSTDAIHIDSPTSTRLEGVFFTSCDEGNEDWVLRASSLKLDTENNEGIARHARINFMHIPIFYFPYLSFPLEGRKTGFLVPSIGDSNHSGTEITIPYYWNIAPHRDATLRPRIMSRRGTLLEGEFRYLNPRNAGEIDLEYIKDDQVFGEDRSAVSFHHQGRPFTGWHTQVNYRSISDEDYLDDFSSELAKSSATHLDRQASIDYRGDYLRASLLVQAYQTVDEDIPDTARPYERLPQLRLGLREQQGPGGLVVGLDSELVQFNRKQGVIGRRLDIQPHVGWPLREAGAYFLPRLSYRYTRYQLERSDSGFDDSPSRSLPLFSVDSGLVMERELTGWGKAVSQTLEPRLFYLNVPYRDQDNLIVDEVGTDSVFDTSLPLFSMEQLFRENRFTGGDRVGDANQLTAALGTRFLDASGRELFAASVGRIFYFRDREVTLPGGQVETDDSSDWVGELGS
ncbi:LPS-assembly protein LptD, partial [Kaarinaea lacus]